MSLTEAIRNIFRSRYQGVKNIQEKEYRGGEDLPSRVVTERYIDRTDSVFLFRKWLGGIIKTERFRENDEDKSRPIIFSMGDRVHDGGTFIDQLGEEREYIEILEEINRENPDLEASLLMINGNHDTDSRIPESITMLSELLGQRIFSQEIGGVLVVAMVGGHTHNEDHLITPIRNKKGEEINLHVVESTSRVENDSPVPPKAYALRIYDGRVEMMRTISENKEAMKKRYEEHKIEQNIE